MTKNELIEKLAAIPGNPIVVLASDEEGNDFHNVTDVELSGTNKAGEPCHPDEAFGIQKVICLWP